MHVPSLTRRGILTAAASTGAAALLTQNPLVSSALASSTPTNIVNFAGPHQAGITTPGQHHLQICAFDIKTSSRAELVAMLTEWQRAIETLTIGLPLPGDPSPSVAPSDTGEALGQTAANLTITIGFGPSLFDGRFGLADQRPPALVDLPAFKGDALDPNISNGDISVQACADSRLVAEHAVRALGRIGGSRIQLRWLQAGFDEPPAKANDGSGRNLFGTKDGTANLDRTDDARMRRNVWVAPGDGPTWMIDGCYQVYRRITMNLISWDDSDLDEQENVIGRKKDTGAPFGANGEFDPVDPSKLPVDSHVRLANPRTGPDSENERILRRGYSFHDGLNPTTRAYDAGLAFVAYQRDPRRQFITIQQRLAEQDALNEYLTHTASGIFAIPPGAPAGQYVGWTLFSEAPAPQPPQTAPADPIHEAPRNGPPQPGPDGAARHKHRRPHRRPRPPKHNG